jgi:4-hydroxy-tetrahydrodipicolinate reductase
MSDMRLIVAGAGGRMGRTLIRAIAETKGVTVSGALEDSGSPLIGRNASELAGVGGQDILITDDAETLLGDADGIIDFTIPRATVALAKLAAKAGVAHVIGTTGFYGGRRRRDRRRR